MFVTHNLESFRNGLFDWRQMGTEILFKLSPQHFDAELRVGKLLSV